MKKTRIAINGFGRIGRVFLRNAINNPNIEIVAINDITDTATLAYLLKYDSIHRAFPGEIKAEENNLVVNGKIIKVVASKDPAVLPWKENDIDIVIESTGLFLDTASREKTFASGKQKSDLIGTCKRR